MVEISTILAPLFVPGNRPDRYQKAAASGADAIILDLEDAVALDQKDAARAAISCAFTSLPVIVRVNAVGTPWHEADMLKVRDLPAAAVMLPKSEDPGRLAEICQRLKGIVDVLPLVETAMGIANARAIAAVPGVVRLAFGSVDYCADLNCAHRRDVLLPARSELVLASRLAGIAAPIDGVTTDTSSTTKTYEDALHARDLGMAGKLCIHPNQIAVAKLAFSPSDEEQVWARRVLATEGGAVLLDGAMIDEPVRAKARRILGASENSEASNNLGGFHR